MITDEDYEKYIRIHMPNVRKLTLEHTVKTVNEVGQVSMSQQSNEVFGLRIEPDPKGGCKIEAQCVDEYYGDIQHLTFNLPTNKFDRWNQAIDNNNVRDQRYGVVLIETCEETNRKTRSGLIMHDEVVYNSIKLILNT